MKGLYNIYPTLTNQLVKLARKEFDRSLSATQCLVGLMNIHKELTSGLNFSILAEDYYWMEHSQVVIFPESTDILERLSTAKFSVSKSTGIQFPHKSFILAFPKNYEINGVKACSCLVTVNKLINCVDHMYKPFIRQIDSVTGKTGSFTLDSFMEERLDENSLIFTYVSPFSGNEVIRGRVPVDGIAQCLAAKDYIEYGVVLKRLKSTPQEPYSLNDEDRAYQFALLNIIIRASIYATVCENALRPGYPHIRPKHLEPKGMTYLDQTLGMSHETRSVNMHYRSWYFRQLMHKKYYRGEHAKKPIGSRIVFVKDTMIGQHVEAETLL